MSIWKDVFEGSCSLRSGRVAREPATGKKSGSSEVRERKG